MKIFNVPRRFSAIFRCHPLLRKNAYVHSARTLDQSVDGVAPEPRTQARPLAMYDKQLRNSPGPRKFEYCRHRVVAFQDLNGCSGLACELQPLFQSDSICLRGLSLSDIRDNEFA